MVNKNNLFRWLLTILVFAILAFYLRNKPHFFDFLRFDLISHVYSISFAFLIFFLTGHQIFIIKQKNIDKIPIRDFFLFPIAQNLWGYILPFQGSIIFSTIYFKRVYKLSVSEGLSLNISLLLISLFMAGLSSGLLILLIAPQNSYLAFFSAALCCLPFLFPLLGQLTPFLQRLIGSKPVFMTSFLKFVLSVTQQTGNVSKFLVSSKTSLAIYFFKMGLTMLWYLAISKFLKLDVPFLSIVTLYFFLDLSLVFKITPGNWGVNQLMSAFVFKSLGLSPEAGVLISTYASLTTLCISFTVGIYANSYFMKKMNISSIGDVVSIFRKTK